MTYWDRARTGAVVVAAGSGTRFGASPADETEQSNPLMAKQFELLQGVPLVCRALAVAAEVAAEVVVVLPAPLVDACQQGAAERYLGASAAESLDRSLQSTAAVVVSGGASRAHSVRNGLAALSQQVAHLVVHDAARPAAPADLFRRVLDGLEHAPGVVPAVVVPDTIKAVTSAQSVTAGPAGQRHVTETLDRDGVVLVQTPQAFDRATLEAAYGVLDDDAGPTDCASVLEAADERVLVVEGDPRAHKITTRTDLAVVEALLRYYP